MTEVDHLATGFGCEVESYVIAVAYLVEGQLVVPHRVVRVGRVRESCGAPLSSLGFELDHQVERLVQVTAEILVERPRELTIACKPLELRVGTQREQYLAESRWKFHAERHLDVRYLPARRGRLQNERPNIVVLIGQELMHLAQLCRHVHIASVASVARTNKRAMMKSIRYAAVAALSGPRVLSTGGNLPGR